MVTNGIIFAILLGVTILGYVIRAGLILMVAGLAFAVFGFTLWSLYTWLSIAVVIVGCVLFWQGARS